MGDTGSLGKIASRLLLLAGLSTCLALLSAPSGVAWDGTIYNNLIASPKFSPSANWLTWNQNASPNQVSVSYATANKAVLTIPTASGGSNPNGGIYTTYPVKQGHSYTVSGATQWSDTMGTANWNWCEVQVDPTGANPSNGADYSKTLLYKNDNSCGTRPHPLHTWKTSCVTNNGGNDYTYTVTTAATTNPLVIKAGNCCGVAGYTLTVDATNNPVRVVDNGAVVGRVLDLAGTPLVGATVVLRRTGQTDLTATTIAGGYWEIDNAPVANGWRVLVSTQPGAVVPIDYYSTASPNRPGVLTINVTGTSPVNCGDLRLASTGCTLGPTWGGSVTTQATANPNVSVTVQSGCGLRNTTAQFEFSKDGGTTWNNSVSGQTNNLPFIGSANVLRVKGTAQAGSNPYWLPDLVHPNYVIANGDQLQYDIFFTSACTGTGRYGSIELVCTDSTVLRSAPPNDQNGVSSYASADLTSRANQKWYHREIALPGGWAGKTLAAIQAVIETDTAGQVTEMYFRNIRIVNGTAMKYLAYQDSVNYNAVPNAYDAAINLYTTTSGPDIVADTTTLGGATSASITGIEGSTGTETVTCTTVPFGQQSSTLNKIRFQLVTNSNQVVTSGIYNVDNSAPCTGPSISTQPTNQTVTVPATATFAVAASGTAPLSYQWEKSTDGGTVWANVTDGTGGTTASYTTPATTTAMSGWKYRCKVTNACGSATSNAVTLTANCTPPTAPTNPGATAAATSITWTWADASSNETGFKVYADPGAGPPTTLRTTTAAEAASWNGYTGLGPNTQHAFQVASTNGTCDSTKTMNHTAWTLANAPTAPVVTTVMSTTLDVAIASGDGNPAATQYAVQVDGFWLQADGSLGATEAWRTAAEWGTTTAIGLTPSTAYPVQAKARNGAAAPVPTALSAATNVTTTRAINLLTGNYAPEQFGGTAAPPGWIENLSPWGSTRTFAYNDTTMTGRSGHDLNESSIYGSMSLTKAVAGRTDHTYTVQTTWQGTTASPSRWFELLVGRGGGFNWDGPATADVIKKYTAAFDSITEGGVRAIGTGNAADTITVALKNGTSEPGPQQNAYFDKVYLFDDGRVVGRVTDSLGALAGATVTMALAGQPDQTTTTGSDGYWEIDNCPVANGWTVTASKAGYCSAAYAGTRNVTGTSVVDCDGLALAACSVPTITVQPVSQTVCAGQTAVFAVAASDGCLSYQWYSGAPGNGTIIGGATSPGYTTGVAGSYYCVVSNPCGSATSDAVTLVVNPLPVAPESASADPASYCAGAAGDVTLTATGGSGDSLRWYTGSCGGTLVGTGSPLTIARPSETTTYYARWESACGVTACASVAVSVHPIPLAPIAGSNSPVCEGGTLNLTASDVPGATYSWTGPGDFASTEQNPSVAGVTAAAAGVYSVTVTVNGCTSIAGSTTVAVGEKPTVVSITPSTAGPTNADSIDFAVVFSEAVTGFDDPGDVAINHSGTSSADVSIAAVNATDYTVTVSGITGDGTFSLSVNAGAVQSATAGCSNLAGGPGPQVTIDNTAPATTAVPAGGLYSVDQSVELTAPGSSAIYYTTDGAEPTTASDVYSTPVAIATTTTLRFFAVDAAANEESPKKQEVYTIDKDAPVIAVTAITQDGRDLLAGLNAVQGEVLVDFTVSDANPGADPTLGVLDDAGIPIPVVLTPLGDGHYRASLAITSTTENGPAGISINATDAASNQGSGSASFTVNKTQLSARLHMNLATGTTEDPITIERCITFRLGGDGGAGASEEPYELNAVVSFVNGTANLTLLDIPHTGAWTRLAIKDRLHTLRSTVFLVDPSGDGQYAIDIDSNPATQDTLELAGGDLTNDNVIDILDFGAFIGQFADPMDVPGCDWPGRHADISGDGLVGTDDFHFIQVGFLDLGDEDCANAVVAAAMRHTGARSSMTVTEMRLAGIEDAATADFNRDGMVDLKDIGLFVRSLGRRG